MITTAAIPKLLGEEEAHHLIRNAILSDKPFMATRFGAVELRALRLFHTATYGLFFERLQLFTPWEQLKRVRALSRLRTNAGVFPVTRTTLKKFYEQYTDVIPEIDLLGSWLTEEYIFQKKLEGADRTWLGNLEPYFSQYPWTEALGGKTVLIVHPFADTITRQYRENRTTLFEDPRILPEFNLKTLQAVQTIGRQTAGYADWFKALENMIETVSLTNFDVAILGCGAYGMPLAAHIKGMGKQAIHLGGSTQILFGIIGKRWEENTRFAPLIGKNWVRPAETEKPIDANKIEGGCYW